MLRGGAFRVLSNASRVRGRGGATYEVAQVDIVRWLLRSFTQDDFVVLHMGRTPTSTRTPQPSHRALTPSPQPLTLATPTRAPNPGPDPQAGAHP